MNKKRDFMDRVAAGEMVYFINTYEEAAIRTTHEKNIFVVKFKSKKEFEQRPVGGKLNNVITNALLEGVEITLTEYENY